MPADRRHSPPKILHPIQVVSKRTGLSQDVIRVWERRHRAVSPERSGTARRLYTEEEVGRLLLLRRATLLGRRIGDVAQLPTPELRDLVEADESASRRVPRPAATPTPHEGSVAETHLAACLDALRAFDPVPLERALGDAALGLSPIALVEQVLAPLMREVGERWHDGRLGIRHEHMVTALVRSVLGSLRAALATPQSGPDIVVATPAGQRHEIGALMAAVAAAAAGWRVSYLGPDLPAEEIAASAAARRARVVALSLVCPEHDPELAGELRRLRALAGEEVAILVGGRCAAAHEAAIRGAGARVVPDVAALAAVLGALR
jgi:methanogenic corrinoid protein MtbC1/DNA-binding transcriptional MerR regulator